jgi:hypothetical protein
MKITITKTYREELSQTSSRYYLNGRTLLVPEHLPQEKADFLISEGYAYEEVGSPSPAAWGSDPDAEPDA